jgi:RNA polymerase sigma-70 factor (ECF subfamily)
VLAAGRGDEAAARRALEQLCQTYWYPLYVFVRRQGYAPPDAQDLTQGFFARALEKNAFAHLDQQKGRFRAFLLAAMKHFLSDQRDHDRAAKRGGGQTVLSLDAQTAEDRYKLEPVDPLTPEQLYERRWALTVLENARTRLREEFVASHKEALYEQLKSFDAGARGAPTYAEIGTRLGLSESAVKSAALRLRRRYAELVREQIAQTVPTAAEIDEEIRHLMAVLAG